VKIRQADYLLVRLADSSRALMQSLGNLESAWLRRRSNAIPIQSPVFITGLARSGTTILLEELSKVAGVGTHRYRDFPFLMTPYFWSRFHDWFAAHGEAVERPHKDRIRITAESPEAFEEPIWQFFFPHLHAVDALHRLTAEKRFPEFDSFFTDHIRKILLIRGADKYVSKGNYNVTRIEYLATLFPDARFVVPIRHPLMHVHSLVRQHALFSDYAHEDPRVAHYLAAAGHYEFGPQRVPIRLSNESAERIRMAWDSGDNYTGYAIQWADVYRFVDTLRSFPGEWSERVMVVRYEDLCSNPHAVMRAILQHGRLDPAAFPGEKAFDHIAPPSHGVSELADELRAQVWRETEWVAARFGYSPASPEMSGSEY
jgi:hypothetical protein